jgi:hypothetical protein
VTPKRRGILYQKVLSSEEPGFISEPAEVQTMLSTVSSALAELKAGKEVTWLLDSGFDDVAVWRTIWEQQEHVVCRVSHRDRIVQWQTESGEWTSGPLEKAAERARIAGRGTHEHGSEAGQAGSSTPKQAVEVEISACPFQITYHSEVRRPSQGKDQILRKGLWLVQVQVLDTTLEPWWLITDWPVETETEAMRIFCMYRQRWAIEDSFKFTRDVPGLGGGASARLAGDQDHGGARLGRCRFFVRDGRDLLLGRSAIACQTGRLGPP